MALREPFDLGSGEPVLFLHGFGGSPFELRPLGEALSAAGFRALGPVLPGHEDGAPALRRTGYDDWLAGAAAWLDAAGARRVVAFSMGACLAIRLAAERDLAGLVLLAPALDFHGASRVFRDLFRVPGLPLVWRSVKKGAPDARDPAAREGNPSMTRVPTSAAAELARAAHAARQALPRVRAPARVYWGAHDHVVPRRAAEVCAREIGSGPAPLTILESSAHQLGLDPDRSRIAAEAVRFFRG